MRSTIGGSRLERILVQSLTSSTYSANCQTLRQAESRSFVLKASGNSELIQDLGKLQIQRHGGATGWQVGKQEISLLNGKAKARTRLRTEVRVISKCTRRCDVTNTDRSPRTLPRAQKPLKKFDHAHTHWHRENILILTLGKSRHCQRTGLARPKVYGAIPRS